MSSPQLRRRGFNQAERLASASASPHSQRYNTTLQPCSCSREQTHQENSLHDVTRVIRFKAAPSIAPRPLVAVPSGIGVAGRDHAPRRQNRPAHCKAASSDTQRIRTNGTPWTGYDGVILLGDQLKLYGAAAGSTKLHKAIRGAGVRECLRCRFVPLLTWQ